MAKIEICWVFQILNYLNFYVLRNDYCNICVTIRKSINNPPFKKVGMSFNLNANFTLPPNPNWRQFRLKLKDKTFIKCRKRVRTAAELSKWVRQYDPTDVYVTTSCWLNPELLGPKRSMIAGYKTASLVLLQSDFFTDYDSKDYGGSIDAAYRAMLGVWESLKQNYSNFTFVRTGKGFQMSCFDWYESLPKKIERVQDRLEYVKQQKKALVERLQKEGHRFDFKQSISPFQIGRVWGGVHNNGTVIEYSKSPFTKALLFPRRLAE